MTSTTATSQDAPPADTLRQGPRWVLWVPVLLITVYYALPAVLDVRSAPAVLLVSTAVVSCAVVVLRHTRPRLAIVVALACLAVSASALGGVAGLLASRARHLPRAGALRSLLGWLAAAVAVKVGQLALPLFGESWGPVAMIELTISTSILAFAVLTGLLVRSTARSTAAERAAGQARAAEIRLEERARIAREMHDVVAHRISLVAMTSGALVYRDDLPEDAHDAVTVIRTNARQALEELRAVLADLRGDEGAGATYPGSDPQAPQPTLEQLPVLLADAREVTDVSATWDIDLASLPPATSRQLYRIVQEGLTNARKHAPGQPVSLRLEHQGADIVLTMRNPMSTDGDAWATPSGYGLVGVLERARLLGGRARVDIIAGRFVLTVCVPARLAA